MPSDNAHTVQSKEEHSRLGIPLGYQCLAGIPLPAPGAQLQPANLACHTSAALNAAQHAAMLQLL